jgi:hypothetical protein
MYEYNIITGPESTYEFGGWDRSSVTLHYKENCDKGSSVKRYFRVTFHISKAVLSVRELFLN